MIEIRELLLKPRLMFANGLRKAFCEQRLQADHKLQKIVSSYISETIKDRELNFRFRFRSLERSACHAHSNGHKPPKPVAPTIFMLDTKF